MKIKATSVEEAPPKKKLKTGQSNGEGKKEKISKNGESKGDKVSKKGSGAPKYGKTKNQSLPTNLKKPGVKSNSTKQLKGQKNNAKPENVDWMEFKQKKKELKLKRKQTKEGYDVITRAKKMGEDLRKKNLKADEKTNLINQLHNLLKSKGHYSKFLLAHDTARIVQWLLKYSSEAIINEISIEIIPSTVDMLQSKYGSHCVKRLLKYGSTDIRRKVVDSMMGHSVKLVSHSISAPIVEYAYSTWATPLQKQLLLQEFFGELYTNSKDNDVKHISDVYKNDRSLKTATLGAAKANLVRILNKSLLDSGLVQTLLCQFLGECTEEDRKEMIGQLASHIVVISNSKDGARAAMQCIWHGSNKDRKIIMKKIKEHLLDLCKHEHGHCVIITLLDCIDDTVLLHKIVLSDILKFSKELAVDDWGRKVLLWLVAPADSSKFHPLFINELIAGREASTCKKTPEIRRKEILDYSISTLFDLVRSDSSFWLSNASLAMELVAIIKSGAGDDLVHSSIVDVIIQPDWMTKENNKEISGIENAGIHMALKKLVQFDKTRSERNESTFGSVLINKLEADTVKHWLSTNRGCFFLVALYENGCETTQNKMKTKLKKHVQVLKKQSSQGAKILLSKIS
ncbi:unnamed protein product [Phyllotreta striolata]|uniref:PUM-HD domain-containing protein n=1 Tax=Phyllotreta striolata TaxID=444603 RepID=A0A9N9XPG2_PHYSR|nr:unnamed protein product [Phyllotreta striolata]